MASIMEPYRPISDGRFMVSKISLLVETLMSKSVEQNNLLSTI